MRPHGERMPFAQFSTPTSTGIMNTAPSQYILKPSQYGPFCHHHATSANAQQQQFLAQQCGALSVPYTHIGGLSQLPQAQMQWPFARLDPYPGGINQAAPSSVSMHFQQQHMLVGYGTLVFNPDTSEILRNYESRIR